MKSPENATNFSYQMSFWRLPESAIYKPWNKSYEALSIYADRRAIDIGGNVHPDSNYSSSNETNF